MRPSVWTTTGDKAKVASIETLPELLDFGVFDEEDFTELLLDFAELLLDFEVFEDEDFTKELLDFGMLEEDWTELLLDFGAPEELEDLTDELLDFGALDEDDFTTLLLDCATLDEDTSFALEELETFVSKVTIRRVEHDKRAGFGRHMDNGFVNLTFRLFQIVLRILDSVHVILSMFRIYFYKVFINILGKVFHTCRRCPNMRIDFVFFLMLMRTMSFMVKFHPLYIL